MPRLTVLKEFQLCAVLLELDAFDAFDNHITGNKEDAKMKPE